MKALALGCALFGVLWPIGAAPLATNGPVITSLEPTSGRYGTSITIRGRRFATTNTVRFRGAISFELGSKVRAEEHGHLLHFRLTTCPADQPPCPSYNVRPGVYAVTVRNRYGVSNEATFELTSH